jgi:hypothetical protein
MKTKLILVLLIISISSCFSQPQIGVKYKFNSIQVKITEGNKLDKEITIWDLSEFEILENRINVFFYKNGERVSDWGRIIKEEKFKPSETGYTEYSYLTLSPTNKLRNYSFIADKEGDIEAVVFVTYKDATATTILSMFMFINR